LIDRRLTPAFIGGGARVAPWIWPPEPPARDSNGQKVKGYNRLIVCRRSSTMNSIEAGEFIFSLYILPGMSYGIAYTQNISSPGVIRQTGPPKEA
jgi:hypothetical protein